MNLNSFERVCFDVGIGCLITVVVTLTSMVVISAVSAIKDWFNE